MQMSNVQASKNTHSLTHTHTHTHISSETSTHHFQLLARSCTDFFQLSHGLSYRIHHVIISRHHARTSNRLGGARNRWRENDFSFLRFCFRNLSSAKGAISAQIHAIHTKSHDLLTATKLKCSLLMTDGTCHAQSISITTPACKNLYPDVQQSDTYRNGFTSRRQHLRLFLLAALGLVFGGGSRF